MRKRLHNVFDEIISVDNLLLAWREFLKGNRNKGDVAEFSLHLMDNILSLHRELANRAYVHGEYKAFKINDPKPRDIHKATVRDRLLHHAIYRVLYPFFNKKIISDVFSCRLGKGTHRAIDRFRRFAYKVSENNTRTCYVLKCDIRKFFASVDHGILLKVLLEHINDKDTLWLLERVIVSFSSSRDGVGLPLGNLTSQLFVNIYMNEFDQFVKNELRVKYYVRYTDDFVVFSEDKKYLENLIILFNDYLGRELKLKLHPNKVFIKTLAFGVDFLGWVNFFDHRTIRKATKKRMLRNIARSGYKREVVQSYLGLLGHGNGKKLQTLVRDFNLNKIERFLP